MVRVEVLRNALDERWAERLLDFWTGTGVLDRAAARERLGEVAAALVDGERVVGTCAVRDTPIDVVGGRRFWVTGSFVLPDFADAWLGLLAEVHGALAEEFDPEADGPIGTCLVVPPEQAERHPAAAWERPPSLHAGRLADGSRLQLAYFEGATVRPRMMPPAPLERWLIDDGASVYDFARQGEVTFDDVVELWVGEAGLSEEEARRRAAEVVAVAVREGRLVGVTTAYLAEVAQLRSPMWHARTYVARDERRRATAGRLTFAGRMVLERRYAEGDTRAPGFLVEIENEMLRQAFPDAVWIGSNLAFIGVNDRGHDVRVRWFRGAPAP